MSAQCRLTIGRILALALVASLVVSPVASAQPLAAASSADPGAVPATATAMDAAAPPLQDIASIATGGYHNCALTNSGGLKCWGANWAGGLGDGTAGFGLSRGLPVDVNGLSSGVTFVAGGTGHTCAVVTGGKLLCWGYNERGQVGNGTTSDSVLTPMSVSGLTGGVVAVAMGGFHTCALTNAGAVKCWGSNEFGQLGDGSGTDHSKPVAVAGLGTGVVGLAAGYAHTCAVTSGGAVKCWGGNSTGQLGDGTKDNRSTPVDVVGLSSGVAAVAGGTRHTCALTSGGGVKCWGSNQYGRLGDGTTTDRTTPVDVSGLSTGVAALDADLVVMFESGHTCAVTTAGGVKCWGRNASGQLGDGTTTNRSTPVDVIGLASGVKAVTAGEVHTCALMEHGLVKCWGSNTLWQVGASTNNYRTLPADVPGLASGAALAPGGSHTCVLTGSGGVKCWGSNLSGQLGDGTLTNRSRPLDVFGLSSGVAAVSAGNTHTCAVTSAGGLKCWGDNNAAQLGDGTQGTNRPKPVDVVGLSSGVNAVATGGFHTCALTSSGGVKCWGRGDGGQLGDGTNILRKAPVDVIGLASGVTAVAAGSFHTCALTSNGGVKCWGWNLQGELGDGTTTKRPSPVDVTGLASGVTALAAGNAFTCALTDAGGVKCWGSNWFGGATPKDVTGLTSGVTALAAGDMHMCALLGSGGVKCWGGNYYGPVGDGTTFDRTIPGDVIGLTSGVTALKAGGSHTCALVGSGRPKCWGSDNNGQLGFDSVLWLSTTPVDVAAAPSPPGLVVNYTYGKPGSIFTITGADFPPNKALALNVNGVALGTTPVTTATGEFLMFLDTAAADAGAYVVAVGASPGATSGFVLLPEAPQWGQEGAGAAVTIPSGLAAPVSMVNMPLLLQSSSYT